MTAKVGDTVRWNDYDYRHRKVLDTQHTGEVMAIQPESGLAIIKPSEGGPYKPVYVHRLTLACP